MDSINPLGGVGNVQMNPGLSSGTQVKYQAETFSGLPFPPDKAGFTELGQMFQSAEGMSDEIKSAFQYFHQQIHSAFQSGNFDAKSLAENAPASIKNLAT